jgi:hypothetical protein
MQHYFQSIASGNEISGFMGSRMRLLLGLSFKSAYASQVFECNRQCFVLPQLSVLFPNKPYHHFM